MVSGGTAVELGSLDCQRSRAAGGGGIGSGEGSAGEGWCHRGVGTGPSAFSATRYCAGMGRRYDTISFLSDLGTRDETVGVVKAVVRDLAPHAVVVDLTHEIAPYDVRGGSLALARAIGYVPSGVVLASVDAIAESGRPLIAIEVADGEGVLVGPDNGLLAPAVAMAGGAGRAVYLSVNDALPSAGACHYTRDVLAAAAARLCNGADLLELGEPADPDTLLPGVVPLPRPFEGAPGVVAEVLWVDRQGTLTRVGSIRSSTLLAAVERLLAERQDVAAVMIAAEKADIALRTMVQVRNKIIDAYQEIMKMQV